MFLLVLVRSAISRTNVELHLLSRWIRDHKSIQAPPRANVSAQEILRPQKAPASACYNMSHFIRSVRTSLLLAESCYDFLVVFARTHSFTSTLFSGL
jgi:hypothetical protein